MLSLQKPNRAVIIVTKNIDALVVKYNITEPKFKFIYIYRIRVVHYQVISVSV